MFFIGIFGVEEKEKTLREFPGTVCGHCGRLDKAALTEVYTYFHVFFIPTFKWNRRYFVRMRCCGAVYEAPAEYAKELKEGASLDFSRLKKVSGGFGTDWDNVYARCPGCGKAYDRSFAYCPYCGRKA